MSILLVSYWANLKKLHVSELGISQPAEKQATHYIYTIVWHVLMCRGKLGDVLESLALLR
jgi:hypothetical protein